MTSQNMFSKIITVAHVMYLVFFVLAARAHAELIVSISESKVIGQKAIVPLALSNGFAESVESARAVMFLLDADGKVVGQATRSIIGGDKSHPSLMAGATNTFHFVVP